MYDTLDEVLGEKIPHLRKKSGKYTGVWQDDQSTTYFQPSKL